MEDLESSRAATQNEREVIAGLAVFFSMSYAPFVIPVLLPSVNFVAVCLVAALASIGAGLYARVPTAMAPGIALAATVGQFMATKHIELANALIICIVAGVILFLTTLKGIRKAIVDAFPDTIKLALAGGIGALLAENALKLLHTEKSRDFAILFVLGLLFITIGYVVFRRVGAHLQLHGGTTRVRRFGWILDICGRSTLFASVPLIAGSAYAFFPNTIEKIPSGSWVLVTDASLRSFDQQAPDYFVLLIFVVWILHADIVGSPYFRALERVHFKTAALTVEDAKTIQKSFEAHSIANIIAPAIGTPPLVYYAENAVSKVLGGEGKLVAYVAGGCFLAMCALGIYLLFNDRPLESMIPQIAVAPVLFFVGLIIIAQTLADSPSPDQASKASPDSAPDKLTGAAVSITSFDSQEVLKVWQNIPAAIAIVVTPVAGFDVGVSFAVLSHYLFSTKSYTEKRSGSVEDSNQSSEMVRTLTAVLLILMAVVSLGFKFWTR